MVYSYVQCQYSRTETRFVSLDFQKNHGLIDYSGFFSVCEIKARCNKDIVIFVILEKRYISNNSTSIVF